MAEIKIRGFEVITSLSGSDLEQLNTKLPSLGKAGVATLETIQKIAAAAEGVEHITFELRIIVKEELSQILARSEHTFPQPSFKPTDSISQLSLAARTSNALEDAKISTVEQLTALTQKQLLNLPRFGRVALKDVIDRLAKYGRSLAG